MSNVLRPNATPMAPPGQVLDGDDWHNKNPVPLYVMNGNPEIDPMSNNFGRNGAWSWRGRNVNYLKFILPKE